MKTVDVVAFVLILIVRGLVPFSVLRWPFWGGLACIAGDVADSFILDGLGAYWIKAHYHFFDKAFDTYYLAFEAWAAGRWVDLMARNTALALFWLRLTMAVLFELTHIRQLFLIGANVFENFYLYVAGRLEIDHTYRIGRLRNLAVILVLVGAPKLLQEYVMHWRQSETWYFVRDHILQWR